MDLDCLEDNAAAGAPRECLTPADNKEGDAWRSSVCRGRWRYHSDPAQMDCEHNTHEPLCQSEWHEQDQGKHKRDFTPSVIGTKPLHLSKWEERSGYLLDNPSKFLGTWGKLVEVQFNYFHHTIPQENLTNQKERVGGLESKTASCIARPDIPSAWALSPMCFWSP
ncbi:hypothetical protein K435DRAFT_874462 [Dendrothele bispora CBS 962.96]|uniref:Uncharacterized protein n=1 Tax=Dendrothele bispora (strain CBS 962.96) TaxID=1314807 RepID=A0A4S8KWU6_DENBC|nr:hypothetical protein K435DRAFT_874462 [Dendrothele bispora CBS 962.96]